MPKRACSSHPAPATATGAYLDYLLREHDGLILLGDPGAGKPQRAAARRSLSTARASSRMNLLCGNVNLPPGRLKMPRGKLPGLPPWDPHPHPLSHPHSRPPGRGAPPPLPASDSAKESSPEGATAYSLGREPQADSQPSFPAPQGRQQTAGIRPPLQPSRFPPAFAHRLLPPPSGLGKMVAPNLGLTPQAVCCRPSGAGFVVGTFLSRSAN